MIVELNDVIEFIKNLDEDQLFTTDALVTLLRLHFDRPNELLWFKEPVIRDRLIESFRNKT